jgi:arsenite methyltransferase
VKVDYGLDAPALVRSFALAGAALLLAGLVFALLGVPGLAGPLWLAGAMLLATSAAMLHSSRRGKLIERDRLLNGLGLRGDEEVLDVGCGRGLLLIGAAKRLPSGRAVGVDVWSQVDQSDNRRSATLANAEAEGVRERVQVVDGDMRSLPFGDASFDAVVSSLAIHNVPDRDGRERAIFEIVRVLRPGGRVAILDLRATGEYVLALEDAGLVDVARSGRSFRMYPPVRVVTGRRPAAQ